MYIIFWQPGDNLVFALMLKKINGCYLRYYILVY